jgi:glycosyltransferase involved in cell wall biosynthesis
VDGLREVVQGAGLLFEHQDAKGLASLIQQLAADEALYNKVANRCYIRAKQFDISKMVEGYCNVYDTMKKYGKDFNHSKPWNILRIFM